MKYTYSVEGMTCNNCKRHVEETISKLPGYKSAIVSLEKNEAIIELDEYINPSVIEDSLPAKYSVSSDTTQAKSAESTSKIQQLKPLFLILAYITIASILMNFKEFNLNIAMMDFMGLFFIVFSFFKFLDIKGFAESFSMYDPLSKALPFYAKIYPFIELGLGLMFLFRWNILVALILTIVILGVTTYGVTRTLISKKQIKCACLGSVLNLPMTEATFIENALMIVMSIVMLFSYI
jgi:copper chaperone CopZ